MSDADAAPVQAPGAGRSLSEKSVIIVGNGASLLKNDSGGMIDSHDIIVRFNAFNVADYRRHTGCRTTDWFNNRPAESAAIKKLLREEKFQRIHVHTWRDTDKAVASFQEELRQHPAPPEIIEVSKRDIKDMKAYLGQGYSMFSTGAIAAWLMLQSYRFITLIGFDWWETYERYHYFDDRQFQLHPVKGHQPHLERIFFQRLEQENRLVIHSAAP